MLVIDDIGRYEIRVTISDRRLRHENATLRQSQNSRREVKHTQQAVADVNSTNECFHFNTE